MDTTEMQAETERISLALHDLAHAVRHAPGELRDHAGVADRLARELRELYERVGEPWREGDYTAP